MNQAYIEECITQYLGRYSIEGDVSSFYEYCEGFKKRNNIKIPQDKFYEGCKKYLLLVLKS